MFVMTKSGCIVGSDLHRSQKEIAQEKVPKILKHGYLYTVVDDIINVLALKWSVAHAIAFTDVDRILN